MMGRGPCAAAVSLTAALLFGGCANDQDDRFDEADDEFLSDGKDDAFGVAEGTPEACAVLRVANELSQEQLDDEVGLDARAAQGIVEARPIASLAELDAVPWVGPVAFELLLTYAQAHPELACEPPSTPAPIIRGALAGERYHVYDEVPEGMRIGYTFAVRGGVYMTVGGDAIGTSQLTNRVYGPLRAGHDLATLPLLGDDVGSPDSGVQFWVPEDGVYLLTMEEVAGRRTFLSLWAMRDAGPDDPDGASEIYLSCADTSCPELTECVSRYGPWLTERATCVPTVPDPDDGAPCAEPGGVYRTVTFTAEEACDAIEYLEHAPWTALFALGGWQGWAWDTGPTLAPTGKRPVWRSVAQFARHRVEHGGVGSSDVTALKTASAEWLANGAPTDTIANLWQRRSALRGQNIGVESAYVQRLVTRADGAVCLELRDGPDAPNYLLACETVVGMWCVTNGEDPCPPPPEAYVGQRVWLRGLFDYTSGRWSIDLSNGFEARLAR